MISRTLCFVDFSIRQTDDLEQNHSHKVLVVFVKSFPK